MSNDTEIIRTIQLEDRTIHIHIHLTEEEIRRLLLPHITIAFADELRRSSPIVHPTTSGGTSVIDKMIVF